MAHISPFHTLDQRLSPLQICTATVSEIFRLVGFMEHMIGLSSMPSACGVW